VKRFLSAAAAFVLASAALGQLSKYKDWAKTPEADFLTPAERQAWSKVTTDVDAEKFIADYWAKRGGEPFRQEVARRIAAADQQFKLRGQKGSESARGRVFLTLGNPSRVQEVRAGNDASSPDGSSGQSSGLAALQDTGSAAAVVQTWIYDKSKFDSSWDVGEVRAQINVDPQRGRDELVNTGLVNKAIDKVNEGRLAEVQKKMAAAGATGAAAGASAGAAGSAASTAPAAAAAPPPPPAPAAAAALPAATRALLEPMLKAESKSVAGFWGGEFQTVTGDPFYAFQIVKFSTGTEPAPDAMKLGGVVTKEDGTEALSIWEDAQPQDMKGINGMDKAVDHSVVLPPGTYRGAFGLFSADGATALTSASTTFTISAKSNDFKVSPMILAATLTPQTKRPNPTDAFIFGMEKPIRVEPRGNHDFSREDGLWYFYTVANPVVPATADAAAPAPGAAPSAPAATTPAAGAPAAAATPAAPSAAPPPPPPAKPRIMTRIGVLRDGKPAFQPATLPAELQPLGTNFYGSGSEIPLASFEPGYYTFTLNVRDLNAPRDSAAFKGIDRTGDFVVLGPDGKLPPTPTPIPAKATPTPRPKKKA
jgi:GWxTD domain-containing protein